MTNLKTIGDFRTGDMALGGQGAPLVPIFDSEFLYSQDWWYGKSHLHS